LKWDALLRQTHVVGAPFIDRTHTTPQFFVFGVRAGYAQDYHHCARAENKKKINLVLLSLL
jgi:hypothetical protein